MTGEGDLTRALARLLRGETVTWRSFDGTVQRVLDVCEHHGIAQLVHRRLARDGGSADWPAAARTALAASARHAVARELVTRRETAAVLAALAAAGVSSAVIKGTALAYTSYDDPSCRPRSDTDLIVGREQVPLACEALATLGYARSVSGGEAALSQCELARTDKAGVVHAFDVHWGISTQAVFARMLTAEEILRAAVPVAPLGPAARAAHPVHALLLACVHPVMHHRNEDRLIWLLDVHLIARGLSARELLQAADLAVDRGVGVICSRALARAEARFGTGVPNEVFARLVPRAVEQTQEYLRPARRWRHETWSTLRALPTWNDRLRLAREVLLPDPSFVRRKYGLDGGLDSAILPALYVYRGATGLWKVLSGRK